MLRGLVSAACRWLQDWNRTLQRERVPTPALLPPPAPRPLKRIQRVVLADEVARTLFGDFTDHLEGPRGQEEVGWLLLGLRGEEEVVVLATLPAGADREAGVAHVRFNSTAQAVGGIIVRQGDRRLALVGVVHTHPGSLRHPSEGDYQGDSAWVGQLRGSEGLFGIGTADARAGNGHHAEHLLTRDGLCFSWYALADGDRRYRRLPVVVAPGPDLARPLHPIWGTIEAHADTLVELCRQLSQISFDITEDGGRRGLVLRVALAEAATSLRLHFRHREVRYYLEREGGLIPLEPPDPEVARAVFLALAEFAARKNRPGTLVSSGSAPAEVYVSKFQAQ